MKIKSVSVDWMAGCGNWPVWNIEFEGEAKRVYEIRRHPQGIEMAYADEEDGAHYLSLCERKSSINPLLSSGFGGSEFTLKTTTGETIKTGAWSSNPIAINETWPENDPLVECSTGRLSEVKAVKLSALKKYLEEHPELNLGIARVVSRGTMGLQWYTPINRGEEFVLDQSTVIKRDGTKAEAHDNVSELEVIL